MRKNIFFKGNMEVSKELLSLKHYAIDSAITHESNMSDDYISYNGEYCSVILPFTAKPLLEEMYKNGLSKYLKNHLEMWFKESGTPCQGSLDKYKKFYVEGYIHLYFRIANPKIVYYNCPNRFKEHRYSIYGNMIESHDQLTNEIIVKKWLKDTPLLNKTITHMKTNTYFNDNKINEEMVINKMIRFANQTLNYFVRNRLEDLIENFNDIMNADNEGYIKYLLGVSSPKRNLIHSLICTNDYELVQNIILSNTESIAEFIEYKNYKILNEQKKILDKLIKLKKEFKLKAYNYYQDEIYLQYECFHFTMETYGSINYYDKFDKGDIVKISKNRKGMYIINNGYENASIGGLKK